MIPHDYHIHTTFSCDGKSSMWDMCQAAIARSIPEIGFTDHFDLSPRESCRDWFKPEPWWSEIQSCRSRLDGQLSLRAGIEAGEPHLYPEELRQTLATGEFDYVLGSLHFIGLQTIFDDTYFQDHPADEVFPLYFEELELMTRTGEFDILAHLDILARVAKPIYGDYVPRRYEACIRPVLHNCIERGIAIEVNAGALRKDAHILLPDLDILRWYAEMGGERVTLGSDAHRSEQVGMDLEMALDAVCQAGFKSLTFFKQRQAIQMPI